LELAAADDKKTEVEVTLTHLLCIHVCVHAFTSIYIYVCIDIDVYIDVYIYVCVYIYIYICIHMIMYIYIYRVFQVGLAAADDKRKDIEVTLVKYSL